MFLPKVSPLFFLFYHIGMNRKISFVVHEFYHIFNRGNDKRVIFQDNLDYKRFINLLFFCNSANRIDMRELIVKGVTFGEYDRGELIVDIGAFCLMNNHFHLLLHEKTEGGVPLFLKKVCTAYSMYFNRKYDRTGKLFEGVFRAEHADTDEYLKYLFSYIHLNPLSIFDSNWKEDGLKDLKNGKGFVEGYQFSSYKNYLGSTENLEVLSTGAFPRYFEDQNIREEIEGWLTPKVTPSE